MIWWIGPRGDHVLFYHPSCETQQSGDFVDEFTEGSSKKMFTKLLFVLLYTTTWVSLIRDLAQATRDHETAKDFAQQTWKKKKKNHITISGKILFRPAEKPDSLPEPSRLLVKFEDVGMAGAPAIRLGESRVDLCKYNPKKKLSYKITVPRPSPGDFYAVSAVLNVGWIGSVDEWIRKKDYITDTMFPVEVFADQKKYKRDIILKLYE